MAKQKCGVYKITNMANGKIYIGSSNNIERRWKQHIDKLNSGTHSNLHLQNAWNKYNKDDFKFEIIEECSLSDQFEREQFYLNTLCPFDDNGYNIVRQISSQYMSDNYMIKTCKRCGLPYNTFSHLSKYCNKCKDEMSKESYTEFNQNKKTYVPEDITHSDAILWGYDNLQDFWESTI